MSTSNASSKLFLQASAGVVALLSIAQAVLGGLLMGASDTRGLHSVLGMTTVVVSLLAVVAAFMWRKASGNAGLFHHAIAVLVLAVVQVGLGELHMQNIHVGLGVAFLVAAVALATLAVRKPGVAA